ncbi:hypothetical protein CDCA_CDCA11G3271 [Cyanidium caldarium]|uniref:Uncharacterized protein n=1 Tax=Cyanidium caldarium TaxID=2771 RepID=A0AAV9IYM3_CYACA|nr:hypothetical protein CDCA_CDCA11G3271 [Cyanidium caldarium]
MFVVHSVAVRVWESSSWRCGRSSGGGGAVAPCSRPPSGIRGARCGRRRWGWMARYGRNEWRREGVAWPTVRVVRWRGEAGTVTTARQRPVPLVEAVAEWCREPGAKAVTAGGMAAATVGVWMSLLWWLWRWRRRRRLKHQQQQQQQRQAALEVLDTEATKRQLRLRAIERAAMMARASAVGETSQDDRGEEQVEVGDVAVAASPIADEEQARSSCSRSSSSPHSKPAYPQMPWWRWALGGWARRPRDPPSRVAHNDARSAPSSDASSSSSTLRSPLYHMLAAEAHATLLSMRSISLNEGGPREEHTNGSWRHDLALAPLKPLQYVHGRMQEIHNEQGAGDAEQLTGALVAVARECVQTLMERCARFLALQDRRRALTEVMLLLRWYRLWLMPALDDILGGDAVQLDQARRRLCIRPPTVTANDNRPAGPLVEAYTLYVLHMYEHATFAHTITYEAKNLAVLQSLFGLSTSEVVCAEEGAAAVVWRSAVEAALEVSDASLADVPRADEDGNSSCWPFGDASVRKRLRDLRRFLSIALREDRATAVLTHAILPLVEDETRRVLTSRRFPDEAELHRLCALAATLDVDVLPVVQHIGEELGTSGTTRQRVLQQFLRTHAGANLAQFSLRHH